MGNALPRLLHIQLRAIDALRIGFMPLRGPKRTGPGRASQRDEPCQGREQKMNIDSNRIFYAAY
jgi:hypothetical protein